MVQVTFYPDKRTVMVEKGTTVLAAARLAGVMFESPCSGTGACGKCRVEVSDGRDPGGVVLACRTEIKDDIRVRLTGVEQDRTIRVLTYGASRKIELDPLIWKDFITDRKTTLIYAGDRVLGQEPGDTRDNTCGAVIDIGTTTLVVSLVDLNTGREMAATSALNPQSLYAQDVLSRIRFASDEPGLSTMHSTLIKELNRITGEAAELAGISSLNIYEVVLSGNTCMLHLAANVNPYPLGQFPYKPQITGGNFLRAAELGLEVSPIGIVYLPPVISAYVGADITSGILALQQELLHGCKLFVDIGTNGEILLGVNGRLIAASTAAGPAFEGMNITCGMRAGSGAIERFTVADDGGVTISIIGETEALGICGSGLLDVAGDLAEHGVIRKNGRLADPRSGDIHPKLKERLLKLEGKPVFKIAGDVYLSQKDIRQVQLAKGAIRAGIEFLLKHAGIMADDVEKVLIAGAFGYHLRAESLVNTGILPPGFVGKISFVGNTSKTGGQAFIVNKSSRRRMEELVNSIEVLELANFPGFERVYMQSMSF